ncbi:hypothetical protein EYF80_045235 [Liparis tanakae]|uniref:Uncharacterized protein n=1 Tax=Liparis tanakae TaxID=230148 RepID=A0A4Z2FU67_9TELE|nr:hypothetical protein EYF80_045235 [Liparis tanakae]
MAAASPYLGQRGRLLHLRRGDVVPGAPELSEHEGVEVLAVLRQAALAEQDSSQLRVHGGEAPHPQSVSIHILLCSRGADRRTSQVDFTEPMETCSDADAAHLGHTDIT